ncbi:TorF family putative porin [Phenylobacterium sp. VNQ135]|uniref:TorF family putative porin n=1 Tax=Phenylobacterium sp. VNQ135 TaxID=3400922 RepID=UPI003C112729
MLNRLQLGGVVFALISLVTGLVPAAAAAAEKPDVSVELGAATEYVSKGVGKSMGDPHVYGTVTASNGPAYIKVYATPVEMSKGSDGEILTTVGVAPKAAGLEFDFKGIYRLRPGTDAGVDSTYWEVEADVTKKAGPVAARLRVNYTPDGFAGTKEAWWVEGLATVKVAAKTKVSAALGVRKAEHGADYTAYNIGVRQSLTKHVDADVRWYGSSRGDDLRGEYRPGLVGSLILKF